MVSPACNGSCPSICTQLRFDVVQQLALCGAELPLLPLLLNPDTFYRLSLNLSDRQFRGCAGALMVSLRYVPNSQPKPNQPVLSEPLLRRPLIARIFVNDVRNFIPPPDLVSKVASGLLVPKLGISVHSLAGRESQSDIDRATDGFKDAYSGAWPSGAVFPDRLESPPCVLSGNFSARTDFRTVSCLPVASAFGASASWNSSWISQEPAIKGVPKGSVATFGPELCITCQGRELDVLQLSLISLVPRAQTFDIVPSSAHSTVTVTDRLEHLRVLRRSTDASRNSGIRSIECEEMVVGIGQISLASILSWGLVSSDSSMTTIEGWFNLAPSAAYSTLFHSNGSIRSSVSGTLSGETSSIGQVYLKVAVQVESLSAIISESGAGVVPGVDRDAFQGSDLVGRGRNYMNFESDAISRGGSVQGSDPIPEPIISTSKSRDAQAEDAPSRVIPPAGLARSIASRGRANMQALFGKKYPGKSHIFIQVLDVCGLDIASCQGDGKGGVSLRVKILAGSNIWRVSVFFRLICNIVYFTHLSSV